MKSTFIKIVFNLLLVRKWPWLSPHKPIRSKYYLGKLHSHKATSCSFHNAKPKLIDLIFRTCTLLVPMLYWFQPLCQSWVVGLPKQRGEYCTRSPLL